MARTNSGRGNNSRKKVAGGGDGQKEPAKTKKSVSAMWTPKKNSPTPRVSLKKVARKPASPKGKAQTRASSKGAVPERTGKKQAGNTTTTQSKPKFQPPKPKEVTREDEVAEKPMEGVGNVDDQVEYAQDNWDGFESSESDRNGYSCSDGSQEEVNSQLNNVSSPERSKTRKR